MTHHHLANIASHGGVPEISEATSAYAYYLSGFGAEDIAAKLFGKATEENTSRVRKLIEQGRAKSLGAH